MKDEITIDGVIYVPKNQQKAECLNDMEFKIIRTYSAGVFAGYIEQESDDGRQVTIRKAVRLWHWEGAASLSQLAMEGTKNPDDCKFAIEVDRLRVIEAIEILDVTQQAQNSINEVTKWKIN